MRINSKARENAGDQIGIGFSLIGWDSGVGFSGPITEQVKQNQCNPGLHSTLNWKLLY